MKFYFLFCEVFLICLSNTRKQKEISVFGDLRSLKETKKNHHSFKNAVCCIARAIKHKVKDKVMPAFSVSREAEARGTVWAKSSEPGHSCKT